MRASNSRCARLSLHDAPMIFQDGRSISRADKLRLRLAQTGKSWTLKQYMSASGAITAVVIVALWAKGAPIYLALFGGLLLGAGLPHLTVGFLMKKRIKNFTSNFPDAIELLVRGLKSGLPVGETLGVVAREIPGPSWRRIQDGDRKDQDRQDDGGCVAGNGGPPWNRRIPVFRDHPGDPARNRWQPC